ncbi:YdcF family protein [Paenibacillus sp. ACRSA]|uniref:YdcF family protein n=1 Tax=Paenibacillus sp. ACRSA TaxID=2918211 RepID=UPI001EF5AC09|nr:YdcF family protein [Paenibacillus sp. ACRSA]MCG7378732.1 YdcF family protein [Paenibacillus sp. ACRSA]
MNSEIAKEPAVPNLTQDQINRISEAVFMHSVDEDIPCDVIFVFGGTHAGHWTRTISAYRKGLGKQIVVTGRCSWVSLQQERENQVPESYVIRRHLIEAGIPSDVIYVESKSVNTLENVLFAKEVFDFSNTRSILMVCKSHAAGRQYRTLKKHLHPDIDYMPALFDTMYENVEINRQNWAETEIGRSRVYGEYLRICKYGDRGDIERLEECLRI